MNLLESLIKPDSALPKLSWDPQPLSWEPLPEGGIRIHVPEDADDFVDPGGRPPRFSAPFLWLPWRGDFVARALTRPHFKYNYDSAGLLALANPTLWAKLCFESTDFGTTAAVSVITDGTSDDANGVDLTSETLWLQMCRVDNLFGLHYSLDGQTWRMVRYFGLNLPEEIRLGVIAQCPTGPGSVIDILKFSVEARRVTNMRAGV